MDANICLICNFHNIGSAAFSWFVDRDVDSRLWLFIQVFRYWQLIVDCRKRKSVGSIVFMYHLLYMFTFIYIDYSWWDLLIPLKLRVITHKKFKY